MDTFLCLAKAGCQWGELTGGFLPYKTVYQVFAAWNRKGVLAAIHYRLRAYSREQARPRCGSTEAIIDSQPVRSTGLAEEVGYDAGKKTKGRRRFNMVDTLGHILSILITPAAHPDREGAKEMAYESLCPHDWMQKMWVDESYSGEDLARHVKGL